MRNQRLNSITYGAIICALVGALLFVNRQLAGAFDLYLFWVIPLPVIVYSIKFGTKQTLIMSVAMVFVSFIVSSLSSLFYVVAAILAGIVYGWGMQRGKSALFLIGSVIIISLLIMFVTTFLFADFFGYLSMDEEISYFANYIQEAVGSYGGAASEQLLAIYTVDTIKQIYIISTILTSVLEGILVHVLAFMVLKRLKLQVPPMKSIVQMVAPTWIKVYVFTMYVASFGASLMQIKDYDYIILPLFTIAQLICFFYGYLLLMTYTSIFIRKKITRALATTAIVVIGMALMPTLGLIDMFTNMRTRLYIQPNQGEKNDQENPNA